jgi:prophage regulatory protein
MTTKSVDRVTAMADEQPASLEEKRFLPPGRILINRKQLRQKIPVCDRTILDMEKRGEFPRRFLVGHKVVWDLLEVDTWIAVQHKARAKTT